MTDAPSQNEEIVTIDHIGLFAGYIATLAFVGSIIFEYGYIYTLELDASKIPISVSDISKDLIIWLPASAFFFINAWSYVNDLIGAHFSKKRHGKFPKNLSGYNVVIIFTFFCYFITLLLSPNARSSWYQLCFFILTYHFIEWTFKSKNRIFYPIRSIVFFILISAGGVYSASATLARTDLSMPLRDEITYIDDKVEVATILRSYEKGYLIKTDAIYFIDAGIVERVRYRSPLTVEVGVLCYHFESFCFDPVANRQKKANETQSSTDSQSPQAAVKPTPPSSERSSNMGASYSASVSSSYHH